MEKSNKKNRATYAKDGEILRVPPPEPQKILLWFTLLEKQFELAHITSDDLKFKTLIKNLGHQYLRLVVDIVFDPPATERYERLKSELISELTDSNVAKVWKSLEDQKIENRTPSQFYRDLKELAGTLIPDDLVLILWKNRLPPSTQQALDVAKEMGANTLTEMADQHHGIRFKTEQIVVVRAERTTAVSGQSNRASNTLHDRVSRLEEQTSALTLNCRGSTSLQHSGLYHKTLSDCANKCYYPCSWNQNQENTTQPSMIATYEVDYDLGLFYVKDTISQYSYLVDTGAGRCLFPRSFLPGPDNRIKDEQYYMVASNGTRIDTYGPIQIYLNLSYKWQFQWQFIIADVIHPTIGMDFMQYYGFVVDTKSKCLFKPTEPAYEVLCHGCHWGLSVPHKPNPFFPTNSSNFAKPSHQTRPSGSGRGRLPPDAEPHLSATSGTPVLTNSGRPGYQPSETGKAEIKVVEK